MSRQVTPSAAILRVLLLASCCLASTVQQDWAKQLDMIKQILNRQRPDGDGDSQGVQLDLDSAFNHSLDGSRWLYDPERPDFGRMAEENERALQAVEAADRARQEADERIADVENMESVDDFLRRTNEALAAAAARRNGAGRSSAQFFRAFALAVLCLARAAGAA